jgi:small-conductance mechanosensitive channel
MRGHARLFGPLFLIIVFSVRALAYDPAVVRQAERLVPELRAELTEFGKSLQSPATTAAQLADVRRRLDDIRSRALSGSAALEAPIAEVTQQLQSLGPAPPAGTTEAEDIATRREALANDLDRMQSAHKQLGLMQVEADQAIERAAAVQRGQFFRRIFEPSRSVLNPILWYEGGRGMLTLFARLRLLLVNWWADVAGTANLIVLALAPALVAFAALAYARVGHWIRRRYGTVLSRRREPDDIDRLWRILRGVFYAFFVSSAFLLILFLTLRAAEVMTPRFEALFSAFGDLVIFGLVMAAFARRLSAPDHAPWRIIDADDLAAGRFAFLATLAAIIVVVERFVAELSAILYLPIGFSVGQSAFSAALLIVVSAACVIVLGNQPGIEDNPRRQLYFLWVRPFAPLVWAIIAAAAVALVLGYVALASFLTSQLVDSAYLIAGLFVLHHLSEAVVAASLDSRSRVGQALRRLTGFGSRGTARLGLVLRTVIDLGLVFVGIPLLLLKWTVTWIDIGSWINAALVGIRIGDITISLSSVILVLAVFAFGVLVTKLAARWLDSRVLADTAVDRGVRDSITQGTSYAGYVLAAALALSAGGVQFSNLAIIAGALGVGIGFGLQSIVNNFISGLILLAERPIRVGDWVQVASGEGIVRRIKVRSTEIETFDSCTIIVPNLSLVAEAVKNWTHHDTVARFRVSLSIPYDSDAEFVKSTMLKLARDHPLVLHRPEPKVLLNAFSTATLELELRAYLSDVLNAAEVASDIRFALWNAIHEKGIGVAVPAVQDVRIVQGPVAALPAGQGA